MSSISSPRRFIGMSPEIAPLSRLSIRRILFILVLAALHMSAIAPRKPATSSPSPAPPSLAQDRGSLYPHRIDAT
jgi:hypothetical protein